MPVKLYLIPNVLSEGSAVKISYPQFSEAVKDLRDFIVEEKKSAQRLLKALNPPFPLDECIFFEFNEHSTGKDAKEIFQAIQGRDAGIISEAGIPCVADPGREIVFLAHQNNREVIPLLGASSIILALAASGLNGQNFAFNGYLPKDREARIKRLKALEERSCRENQTQIFMEAPYRNENLLRDILTFCSSETLLGIAADITGQGQFIKTFPIHVWRTMGPSIHKKPAIFLLGKN